MFASVFNFKRYLAGVAITWALVLMVMHEKLLKQHRDNEKAAVSSTVHQKIVEESLDLTMYSTSW